MNELNRTLREQAVYLGLCDEWQTLWNKDWDKEKMVKMMFRGLDFCIKHHYPSNDFLQKNFDLRFLRDSNIFVNDKYSIVNPKECLILGNSEITIRFNSSSFGFVHLRDDSSANIYAKNRSCTIVHLYEKAKVNAWQFDRGRIVLVKHSPYVSINAGADIKIREE